MSIPDTPGRSCPVHYRYRPEDIANAAALETSVLYVIGGLYGNVQALETIIAMAALETAPVTLCFNGDFNWFNLDLAGFEQINETVLQYDALRGNVETELSDPSTVGDCGCAYPAWVDTDVVDRSNLIIQTLKATAAQYPEICLQLGHLPMFRRYHVGEFHVAVVHGDCESLSGWGLAQETIDTPFQRQVVDQWATRTACQVIASTHTCLPFLFGTEAVQILNNGAAGMPNFSATQYGCVSRIATVPRPEGVAGLYGRQVSGIFLDAVPVHYDQTAWIRAFRRQWSESSPAFVSYYGRLEGNISYTLKDAQRFC